MNPIIVGIAGGSGAGKSTVVQEIVRRIGTEQIAVLQHDWYYRDRGELRQEDRAQINYDHPEALETELLIQHLGMLFAGQAIEAPVYDFATHTRSKNRQLVHPRDVIIVEGILVLVEHELRCLLEIKVYVETDADIRFIRRLMRDIEQRDRSLESIVEQYVNTVKPMHLQFVEPSKRWADIIMFGDGSDDVSMDTLIARVLNR